MAKARIGYPLKLVAAATPCKGSDIAASCGLHRFSGIQRSRNLHPLLYRHTKGRFVSQSDAIFFGLFLCKFKNADGSPMP
ncbi:hypothetical protein BH11ARM2_BH11ARM2_04610 [soil metagenome]